MLRDEAGARNGGHPRTSSFPVPPRSTSSERQALPHGTQAAIRSRAEVFMCFAWMTADTAEDLRFDTKTHRTRTSTLYICAGLLSSVEPDTQRSQIVRVPSTHFAG
jgi:hypothetical protein